MHSLNNVHGTNPFVWKEALPRGTDGHQVHNNFTFARSQFYYQRTNRGAFEGHSGRIKYPYTKHTHWTLQPRSGRHGHDATQLTQKRALDRKPGQLTCKTQHDGHGP